MFLEWFGFLMILFFSLSGQFESVLRLHEFNCFSFVQIFGPQTSQQEVYDHTIREMVRDVLHGENRLLYTYGVTNSGKTYTIQGKMAA